MSTEVSLQMKCESVGNKLIVPYGNRRMQNIEPLHVLVKEMTKCLSSSDMQ